ncbi:MAG: phosphatidate cytidylyltransferase [Pirellulaceae bacterium]
MTPMERLFDPSQALADAVTLGMVVGISVVLVSASLIVRVLELVGLINPRTRRDLLARERAWYLIALAVVLPILAGAAWVCLASLILALLCFREFARAAKLSESKTAMGSVVTATLLTFAAVIDHWQELFSASFVIGVAVITVSCLLVDQPHGYLRRIGLSLLGYFLFCASLAHLAYFSNGEHFRPILLWLLLCTELNDVFAFTWGKVLGHRKLMPNTSPNKTWVEHWERSCARPFAALWPLRVWFHTTLPPHSPHRHGVLDHAGAIGRLAGLRDQTRLGTKRHVVGSARAWRFVGPI